MYDIWVANDVYSIAPWRSFVGTESWDQFWSLSRGRAITIHHHHLRDEKLELKHFFGAKKLLMKLARVLYNIQQVEQVC